jgi:hypothetical protein
MNLIQFREALKALALSTDGIDAFSHGWIQDLNGETSITYPHLRMTPPVQVPDEKSDEWSITYKVKLYLLAKNDSNGDALNNEERDQEWTVLQSTEKLLRATLEENNKPVVLTKRLGEIKFNEGYLTNDDPLWISFDYQIRAVTPC